MVWPGPEKGSNNPEYQFSPETITKGAKENFTRIAELSLEVQPSELEVGRQPHAELLETVSQEEGK